MKKEILPALAGTPATREYHTGSAGVRQGGNPAKIIRKTSMAKTGYPPFIRKRWHKWGKIF